MNFKKIITGLLLSLLLGSGVAVAADFSVGLQAAQSGDFKASLFEWTPLAEQGYAMAQFKASMPNGNVGILALLKEPLWSLQKCF